jgi:hypothetical protein
MSQRPIQNRYPQARIREIWSRYCPSPLNTLRQIGAGCKRIWKILIGSVGPVEDNKLMRPHAQTVVCSLLVFVGFIVFGSFAVRFPTSTVRLILTMSAM